MKCAMNRSMNRKFASVASTLPMIALLGASLTFTPVATADETEKAPQVGDEAPDFEMLGSDGKTYRLKDFKGKKPFVIAWFPKAFTGG